MPAGERFLQSFVIAGQPSESAKPSETAFDNPPSRQKDETSLGFAMLHHFQPNAIGLGLFSDFRSTDDAFRLVGRVIAYYKYSDTVRLSVGGTYLDREDITWLPIGGVIWGNFLGVDTHLALVGLKVFPVVILGGLDSVLGAILGGLIVGLVENVSAGFIDPYVGGGTKDFMPYVLMIIALMIRPSGFFGREIIERV